MKPTLSREDAAAAIASCAEQRAENMNPREMTIGEALERAAYLETPGVIVDPDTAKAVIRTLTGALQASPCYYKATLKGEEVFVLRQQDRAAPLVIRHWAALADDHGCHADKVHSAQAKASRWQAQDPSTTKWPD